MKGGTFTDRQTVRWDIPPPRVSGRPFVCRPTASFVRSFVHFAPFSLSLSHLGRTPFCAVVAAFIVQPDGVERARMGAVFVDSRACSFWTLKRFLPHVVGDGRRSEERTTAAAEGTNERTNDRTNERAEFWGMAGGGREGASEHRHLLPASFQAPQPIPYIEWGAVGWREQGTANRGMDVGSRVGKGGREKE